ncbi:MAG: HU family DNA-binding protein [Deltaproteobacteria bacterium]|nr:HU family DNA-binding protein [Deltaproteobacteria bacterium]
MSKKELVSRIASATDQSKAQTEKALNATLDSIKESLSKGDDVSLIGFGTFTTSKRAEREGRNPKTGEKIKIKAATVPKFRPGKALKDAVN